MPLPRKSTLTRGKSASSTAKKKKTTARRKTSTSAGGRAKKGELLLVTCAPAMPDYIVEDVAQGLHGSFFTAPDGRYLQVVAVRIAGRKIYGTCQEMYEAAPYMFAPVSSIQDRQEKPGKTLQVELHLVVQGNSKYVRGEKKVRRQIEDYILSQYDPEKHANDLDYTLTIPYETDEQLERIIYEEILREAASTADGSSCFIEADVRALDDSGRHW